MRFYFVILLLLAATNIQAKGVYQHPDAFLQETFSQQVPKPKFVWYTGDLGKQVSQILAHKPSGLRTRYWLKADRSAWILEEIGKEKPITVGIVISDNRIERIKVLIFRETRGWEIKRNSFTAQFKNISLNRQNELSDSIDGISGATLSVNAVSRLAKLALFLHQHILNKDKEK